MSPSNTHAADSEFKVQSSEFKVQCSSFADRLLPLCDGRPGLRGTMPVEVREPSLSFSGGEGCGAPHYSAEAEISRCLDRVGARSRVHGNILT